LLLDFIEGCSFTETRNIFVISALPIEKTNEKSWILEKINKKMKKVQFE
jgi:hypothetical protein